ncbi:gp13 protein [Mycobacteroides abscessus subsp. bolletii]|nr:gp13 protein [Mycobacteroides abscessus subsp. bolletii]SHT34074.1 gp13 protein [Mycobacteroides abscessus subsp. bolletii]SHT52243.1 gp13 protein [Mycobacteroides abscessus subsp. bolletii]SKG65637.1 gp13 protein [Mycobacteroides abscessus subsp. bolletii]SKH20649.1 gp13 protein [Mycobacteroides abscessus subsp. bolletii]
MTSALSPVLFDAPLVNPNPLGLYPAAQWTESADPLRWLPSGVEIRPWNFGLAGSFGVWAAAWNARAGDLGPDDVKHGQRPAGLAAFAAVTVWAADECDLTAPSQAEVRTRAAQTLRLMEQGAVEREFAARLLEDAGTVGTAAGLVAAVGHLEEMWVATNTQGGFIHARAVVGGAGIASQSARAFRPGVHHSARVAVGVRGWLSAGALGHSGGVVAAVRVALGIGGAHRKRLGEQSFSRDCRAQLGCRI